MLHREDKAEEEEAGGQAGVQMCRSAYLGADGPLLSQPWLRLVGVRGGPGLMREDHICLDYPSREEARSTTGESVSVQGAKAQHKVTHT